MEPSFITAYTVSHDELLLHNLRGHFHQLIRQLRSNRDAESDDDLVERWAAATLKLIQSERKMDGDLRDELVRLREQRAACSPLGSRAR